MSFASKLQGWAAAHNASLTLQDDLQELARSLRESCKDEARDGRYEYFRGTHFLACPPEPQLRTFEDLLRTLLSGCYVDVTVEPNSHKYKDVFINVQVRWHQEATEGVSLSMPVDPVLTPSEQYEAGTPKELPQRTVAQTLAGAKKR